MHICWTYLFLPLMALLMPSFAVAGGITYHGRLLKSDGTAVTSSNVEFIIQIRTPGTENCLMYQEVHIKDLSQSNGIFAIGLNDGTAATPNSEPFTLDRVFQNRGTFSFGVGKCSGFSTYTPNPSDGRKIAVEFNDGTFLAGTYEPLPTQSINFVPMAVEAITVGGFNSGSMMRVVDGSGNPNSISALSIAQHNTLMAFIGGTAPIQAAQIPNSLITNVMIDSVAGSKVTGNIGGNAAGFTGNLAGDVTGAQATTTVARIQGRNVDTSAPADGQVLKWDATDNRWEPAADSNTGAIAGITGTLPVSVSAGANPVVSIADGTTGGKGAVQLALDGESNGGKALASNDSRLTDARAPTTHSHTFASLTNSAAYMDYRPNNASCGNNEVLKYNLAQTRWECGTDNTGGGGGGGVTSVGVAVPAYMTSSGGPITTSGDITIGFGSQAARTVFAAPTGGNGAPTFRTLNIGDIFSTNTGGFLAATGACPAGEQLTYLSMADNISCQAYSLTSAQVTGALTFTPANATALANYLPLAGGTMGGNLNMGGQKITNLKNVPNVAADPAAGQDGQALRWNQTAGQWEWYAPGTGSGGITSLGSQTGSSQTFAAGAAGTAPAITSATDVHTLNVPLASGAGVTSGTISKTEYDAFTAKVAPARTIASGTGLTGGGDLSADRTLAVNVGTGSGQIPQLNGSGKLDASVIPANVITSNTLAGDVTGNFGASVVEKVRGVSVSATTPQNGQAMMFVGGSWTPTNFGIDDLMSNAGTSQFASASCTASQTLTWSALTDTFTCANIVIASANITDNTVTGTDILDATITLADFATSVADTMWTATGGNVFRASGNVGIGTTTASQRLTVAGTIESTSGGIKFPDGTTQTTAAAATGSGTAASAAGYVLSTSVGGWPDVAMCHNSGTGRKRLIFNLGTNGTNMVYYHADTILSFRMELKDVPGTLAGGGTLLDDCNENTTLSLLCRRGRCGTPGTNALHTLLGTPNPGGSISHYPDFVTCTESTNILVYYLQGYEPASNIVNYYQITGNNVLRFTATTGAVTNSRGDCTSSIQTLCTAGKCGTLTTTDIPTVAGVASPGGGVAKYPLINVCNLNSAMNTRLEIAWFRMIETATTPRRIHYLSQSIQKEYDETTGAHRDGPGSGMCEDNSIQAVCDSGLCYK